MTAEEEDLECDVGTLRDDNKTIETDLAMARGRCLKAGS